MYGIELFERAGGYGFRILKDGVAMVDQPNDPDQPGDEPMTTERALAAAQEIIDRLVAAG